jgi:predicted RNA polymerase sigma factor
VAKAGINPELRVAELAGRSHGRLLALLAAPTGDIPAAEDALADAWERALTHWRADGVPANPEGWVLTVARNRLRDLWKSHAYRMTGPLPETDSSQRFPIPTPMHCRTVASNCCWSAHIPRSAPTSAPR